MYKIFKYLNISDNSVAFTFIARISDGVSIPQDNRNRDYQEYLEWIKQGNTPQEETVPNLSFEEKKKRKIDDITRARIYALNSLTCEWNSDVWDAREEDSTRITNVLTMLEQAQKVNIPTPSTIDWRTYNDQDRTLTVPELIQLAASMFLAQQVVWAKQAQLKNQAMEATTEQQLNSIIW